MNQDEIRGRVESVKILVDELYLDLAEPVPEPEPEPEPIPHASGVQTFGKVQGDEWDADPIFGNYPESKLAYFRPTWADIERTEGMIEDGYHGPNGHLRRAVDVGQQLCYRLMPMPVPQWLRAKNIPGIEVNGRFFPRFDNTTFMAAVEKHVHAVGRILNGKAAFIDIGMLGDWGECQVKDTYIRDGESWIPRPDYPWPPSYDIIKWYVNLHFDAFPNSKLLVNLNLAEYPGQGGADAVRYALSLGAGLRWDSLGDPWHEQEGIPRWMQNAGITDAELKRIPVHLECMGNAEAWVREGLDYERVLNDAIDKYHATVINFKSNPIPEVMRPAVDKFIERAGQLIKG